MNVNEAVRLQARAIEMARTTRTYRASDLAALIDPDGEGLYGCGARWDPDDPHDELTA